MAEILNTMPQTAAPANSRRRARPSNKARRRRRPAAAAAGAAAAALALALLALLAPRAALAGAVSTALEAILRLPPVPLTTAATVLGVDASTQPNGVGPTWTRALNDVVAPPPGSPASVVRARVWTNATAPGFLYPEQDPSPGNEHFLPRLVEKPNFGVCMSGGGLRAAILMLGYGRVLWREGLWQKARYAGGSSGSAWFLAAVSYANSSSVVGGGGSSNGGGSSSGSGSGSDSSGSGSSNGSSGNGGGSKSGEPHFDGEAFFGRYLPPERLTEEAAQRELGSWGRAVAEAALTPHSLWSGPVYRRRALTWWTDAVADLFLRPFGLSDLASGTGAFGTRGPVAERVAAALERAARASKAAEARQQVESAEGNARAVAELRARVASAVGGKAGDAAAAAASALLLELDGGLNATKAEARWARAAKLGVRRVLPPNPAGGSPPVYLACTQDRPYPLMPGTIFAPRDKTLFYPFEMTPMYVGAPGAYENATSPVGALGGGMVETHAWNSRLTAEQSAAAVAAVRESSTGKKSSGNSSSNNNGSTGRSVDATVDYFVPLAGQIGVSSAFMAQGFRPSSAALKQVGAVDHLLYWNQLDFAKSAQVEFADGGGADPLAIYGQLRRGVRALLVLHATFQEPTGAAEEFALAGGYEVSSLFGYVPRGSTRYSGTDEKATAAASQVFEAAEWPPLYQELRARFYAGEPPVIRRKKLRVLPNAFQAVRGGYDADVLFVFNVRTAGWEERLPLATRVGLERGRGNVNSPLGSYPVVPTGLAHAGPGLTSLLSQQASWTMIHALPALKAMLADLPEGERGIGKFATTAEDVARAPSEAAAMAVGLRVGEAPAADVDRADAGLGAFGEKVIDGALALLPAVAAAPPAAAAAGAAAGATPSPLPRGPGAAAVIGNARVMAALANAPAESGVGSALAALKAASSPLLVDGKPPSRAESRAAALAANDPRPAHVRFFSRQYTRVQALGAAIGGLRTQAIADTAGKLVSGVEDRLGPPVVKAVRGAAAKLAPVEGPVLRAAAAKLAAGDMHGANPA